MRIRSSVNPYIKRRRSLWVFSCSDARGRANHQLTNPIHAAHINKGPSRAAHVAAKRYLSGRSSPPFSATWRMSVSLTMKRDASATKGAATAKWRPTDASGCSTRHFGQTIITMQAMTASPSVHPHMFVPRSRRCYPFA